MGNASDTRLRDWQRATVVLLFVGYTGYYFCRSSLSIAAPLLLEEFGPAGLDKTRLGLIATIGTAFYFIGKLVSGVLADMFGGKRLFLLGMVVSVGCTVAFGLSSGFAAFVAAWALNRFFQSMGWNALVKVSSNWFSFAVYGTVMGILSLSYFFGDTFVRFVLGAVLGAGAGWRATFFVAALVLLLIAVMEQFLLKDSPRDVGASEPPSNPSNLFGDADTKQKASVFSLMRPLFSSGSFWLVAILSFGLTLIREAFNFWTPTYLTEAAGVAKIDAGLYSLTFPFFGGLSVLFGGIVTDRLGRGRRGAYMLISILLLTVVLFAMGSRQSWPSGSLAPHLLVAAVALTLAAPYSFLAGAISLDFGGKTGSATAAGLIDSIGYVGGMASGQLIGAVADQLGWSSVFIFLAGTALLTSIAAALFWRYGERQRVER